MKKVSFKLNISIVIIALCKLFNKYFIFSKNISKIYFYKMKIIAL